MKKIKKFKYSWFRDQKMLGMILLIIVSIIQIFAFLKVPIISTIHAYTFGMLVGFYNPLIYVYIAYMALLMIFGEKLKLPNWVKFNKISYLFLVISIIFIGVSPYYQIKRSSFTDIGLKPWKSMKIWFKNFTSSTAWAPANTNGGVLGAFLYSFFAMISSGIGALIISIVLLFCVIYFIITGSFFGLLRQTKAKRILDLKQKEIQTKNESSIDEFIHQSNRKNITTNKPILLPEKKDIIKNVKKVILMEESNKDVDNNIKKEEKEKVFTNNELPFDDSF